MFMFGAGVA